MKRGSPFHAAVNSAFARSRAQPPKDGVAGRARPIRIHPLALAFVVGFPGAIGAIALLAAMPRSGQDDGAFPLGVGLLALAAVLLILGVRSAVWVGPDALSVRFFGLRFTTVRFDEITSATFGMAFPSISFAIVLTDRRGRKALVHANWWRDETTVVTAVCRALVRYDMPMDRSTARIVSQVLRIRRPRAQITHHGLLRKDRTW
jgi:hypothetical protein